MIHCHHYVTTGSWSAASRSATQARKRGTRFSEAPRITNTAHHGTNENPFVIDILFIDNQKATAREITDILQNEPQPSERILQRHLPVTKVLKPTNSRNSQTL